MPLRYECANVHQTICDRVLKFLRETNPVFPFTIKGGAKFIVILQMVFSLIMILGLTVFAYILHSSSPHNEIARANSTDPNHPNNAQNSSPGRHPVFGIITPGHVFVSLLISVLEFILYVYLLRGIKTEAYDVVNKCWKIMAWYTAIYLLGIVIISILEFELFLDTMEMVAEICNLYTIWILYAYKHTLKKDANVMARVDIDSMI